MDIFSLFLVPARKLFCFFVGQTKKTFFYNPAVNPLFAAAEIFIFFLCFTTGTAATKAEAGAALSEVATAVLQMKDILVDAVEAVVGLAADAEVEVAQPPRPTSCCCGCTTPRGGCCPS